MKSSLLSILAVLALAHHVFASWAAHLVISPGSIPPDSKPGSASRFPDEAARLAQAVSVREAGKSKLKISIEPVGEQETSVKGYYLVIGKTRFAANALDLRPVLQSWRSTKHEKRTAVMVEDVRRLQPSQRNGTNVVEVVLKREKAMRSYIVWDCTDIYEKGAFVVDGGLWLTYDIPAFVEACDVSRPTKDR